MALKIEKTDSESHELRGRATPPLPAWEEPLADSPHLLLILDHWKLIGIATFVVVVATFIVTKTLMTKWYQATAIIEPVPEGAVENRVEGGLGGLGAGGISSLLMSSGIDAQAQEYLTILRSYTFNTEVAERHNLVEELLRDNQDEKPKTIRKLKMKLFDVTKARFKVDYSMQAHNLSVHFIDRDPVRAQEILQYYLDDLRELQRAQEIKRASAAITSLEKEAKSTGDSLLRESLYALVARQVQRQKLAEVEADFAFKILEAPVAPDRPYSPRASLNCFVMLLLTPLLTAGFVLARNNWQNARRPRATSSKRRSINEHSSSF